MSKGRRFKRSVIGTLALASVLATASYAFTASNTIPATEAGSGSGTISGYTATSVAYTLNATDPTKIDAVAFTISPTTTSQVKIKLVSSGTTWYSCTNTAGSVSCTTTSPQATVATADQLSVVAVG